MNTTVTEIGDRIYRLSTFVPEIAPPAGFVFNQFLIDADEPVLFHCGPRRMFPLISAAVAKVMPVAKIRWIGFGHVESDECGSMNLWLAGAPRAEIIHGLTACNVSLQDLADRPPRTLANGEGVDIGTRRIRYIDTPHVPHGWEAGVLFEETTRTLLCGDLFTHTGNGPAVVESDIVAPAIAAEDMFHATSLTPSTAPSIRDLAGLEPLMLAVMHGSSYRGDCGRALHALADAYERRLRSALPHQRTLTPA
jgi:flavorubredoxin